MLILIVRSSSRFHRSSHSTHKLVLTLPEDFRLTLPNPDTLIALLRPIMSTFKLLLVLVLALLSIALGVGVETGSPTLNPAATPSKKAKAGPKVSTGLGAKAAPQNATAILKGIAKAAKAIKSIGVNTKETTLACRVLSLLGCKEPDCCKQKKCDFCSASIQVAGLAFTCAKMDNANAVTGITFEGGLINACPANGKA